MPRLTKKFTVFNNDVEIFKYIPEDDDRFIGDTAKLYDTLAEAKKVVKNNLKKKYQQDLKDLEELTYKEF